MQTQLNDLSSRMGDLTGYIRNLEQLIRKLAEARESAA